MPPRQTRGPGAHHQAGGRAAAAALAAAFGVHALAAFGYPQLLGNGKDMARDAFLGAGGPGLFAAPGREQCRRCQHGNELRADLDEAVSQDLRDPYEGDRHVTAHDAAVVDTSIIAALKLYDPAELPGTILITAVTIGELSFPEFRSWSVA